MIVLAAAVPFETELLRTGIQHIRQSTLAGFSCVSGMLSGQEVSLIHTGIGKANAAAAATLMLETHHPRAVLCLGIGGAYPGSGLVPGDLALATEEIFGDEGAATPQGFQDMEALGFALHEQNGLKYFNRFPLSASLAQNASELLSRTGVPGNPRQLCGPFVTVSACSSRTSIALEIERRTGGICENMEGAAIAQVCLRYDIPFCELRGISNLTEDRGLSAWDIRAGARTAQEAARILLSGLTCWS